MDDFDDGFKVGKPGDPHPVADCFEARTIIERARGEFDRACAFQEIANRLRRRESDPYRALRGFPLSSDDDSK